MEVRFFARLEDACSALAERVAEARRLRGPLDPVTLWVPSVTVGAFAKMALARHLDIAAQIRTSSIVSGLGRLGAERDPPLLLATRERLRGGVLAALHDRALMAEPVMAPLAQWVAGSLDETQSRRRSEVAAQLAGAFDGYLTARPRWLAERTRARAEGRPLRADETWQLRLLDHVLARMTALPLGPYVARLVEPGAALPLAIHVVGWSILPLGVLDALELLSRHTAVHVYAPNPSSALWADPSIPRRDAGSILLAESGRALRELVLTLSARTDQDAGDMPSSRDLPDTALGHLQRCLEEATDVPREAPPDDSLQVVAAPGVRREVEMVAQEIWRLLEADSARGGDKLTLDRIAIYYVDREEQPYATHIDAVLHEAHQLPRRLTDTPLSRETPVVGAVRALLEVPLGQRTRPELLGVLTHPLVRGRWPDVDPAEWLAWCAAAGVVRGADAHDLEGSYAEGQRLYHWDQGLVRLALGTLTDDTPVAELGPEPTFPEPIAGTRARGAGRLILLARSLIEDARWAAEAELTIAEWVRFLGEYVATYLVPRDQATTAALRACLAAINGCAAVDAGEARVPYRVARDLAVEAVDALTARRGAELAGGIHVAPLKVGSIVPFEVIFVLGLDAGRFPARSSAGDLDVRPRRTEDPSQRDVEEVSLDATAEDRDRAAFLEVVGAARRRLVLSWESRDAVTGEEKSAASSVGHVLRWYEVVHGRPLEITKLPLRRGRVVEEGGAPPAEGALPLFGDAAVGSVPPVTAAAVPPIVADAVPAIGAERRASALGRTFAQALGRRPREDEVRAAIAAAPEALRGELRTALGVVPLPERLPLAAPTSLRDQRIPLSSIKSFLTCPLQGSAQFALGMEEDETDDTIELDVEPLSSGRFARGNATRDVFLRGVAEPDPDAAIEEAHRARTARRRAQGDAPSGLFGAAEQGNDDRALHGWAGALSSTFRPGTLRPLGLGAARAGAGKTEVVAALRLSLPDERRVTITGQTGLVCRDPRASVVLQFPRAEAKPRPSDVVRVFLDHVLLTLVWGEERPHALHVLSATASGEVDSHRTVLEPISVDAARAFLVAVVEAMLEGPLDVLFPIEAAIDVVYKRKTVDDAVDALREDLLFRENNSISSRYGPIRDPAARPAPSEALAREILERLGPLFNSAYVPLRMSR